MSLKAKKAAGESLGGLSRASALDEIA